MSTHRRTRIAVITTAIGALVLMTAGVTYAAASASKSTTVKACVSTKDVLSLLTAKGKCARGSREVNINEQGPAGKTGKRGPKGDPGVAAPTPISIGLDTTDATLSSKTFPIGSTGLTVTGTCFPGTTDSNQLVLSGSTPYFVHGAAQYLDSDGGNLNAQIVDPAGDQPIATGSSFIAYESSASFTIEEYVPKPTVNSEGNLQLFMDLVVLTGGQTFSVHVFQYFDGSRCQLSAQVIAS